MALAVSQWAAARPAAAVPEDDFRRPVTGGGMPGGFGGGGRGGGPGGGGHGGRRGGGHSGGRAGVASFGNGEAQSRHAV